MTFAEGENWLFSYDCDNIFLSDMNSIMTEVDKIINNQAMDTRVLEQLLI